MSSGSVGTEITVIRGDYDGEPGTVCDFISTDHGVEVIVNIRDDYYVALSLADVRIGNPKKWAEDLDSYEDEEDEEEAS